MKAKGRIRDMTTGNVFQNILMFAIPLFISNFFQQCYNICDTMIASHNLGEHALAAIGLTGSISGLIIGFANGMNNGYGIIIAQSFGAQNLCGCCIWGGRNCTGNRICTDYLQYLMPDSYFTKISFSDTGAWRFCFPAGTDQ